MIELRQNASGVAIGLALACAPLLAGSGQRSIVVGAKNFSEQFTLARLIGARLARAGYTVSYRQGLGSAVALHALQQGDIDVYVEYSGTIWADAMHRKTVAPRAEMLRGIADYLRPSGAALLGPLGFENAYALAMTRSVAAAHHVTDLQGLAAAAPTLNLGADLEYLSRPEWRAVRDGYDIRFASTRNYAPSFMYRALESRQVDIISAFSSDGRIAADDLVVLGDPKHVQPGYDAILLAARAHAHDQRFLAALTPLVGAIPVTAMRQANYMVDRDTNKATPEASAQWLAQRLATR